MNRNEILDSILGLANVGMSCVLSNHGEGKLSDGEYDVLFRALQCVASYCNEMKFFCTMMKTCEGKKLSNVPWNYVRIGVEEYNKEIEKEE